MLQSLTSQLEQGQSLDVQQVEAAVAELVHGEVPVDTKAAFLSALARKGETAGEIAAFAHCLREMAVPVPLDAGLRQREILDVCGTGGDRLGTFNISTTVALVAAAAGVVVAKHGNKAITSPSGSADVLAALGIPVTLSPAEAARALAAHGFAFLFAPHYHPAFRHLAAARQQCAAQGQRTIFNFLGPLLNPARPTAQLVGVPRPELCEPLARVLQQLGLRRGMVVCGRVDDAHLDEVSTLGETAVAEFYQDRGFSTGTFSPVELPLQPATLADLRGGDAAHNAQIIRHLLAGRDRGPRRDAVLLNAGAALFVAGEARTIADGWERAAAVIDSGAAAAKLAALATQG